MSVIIRLQNLPWSANAADIRGFFKGLLIPEGGVHIVGGEQGDAFIAFGSDEDARLAMRKTGEILKGIQITLLLSSRAEMQKVIETAREQALAQHNFLTAGSAQPAAITAPAPPAPPAALVPSASSTAQLMQQPPVGQSPGYPPVGGVPVPASPAYQGMGQYYPGMYGQQQQQQPYYNRPPQQDMMPQQQVVVPKAVLSHHQPDYDVQRSSEPKPPEDVGPRAALKPPFGYGTGFASSQFGAQGKYEQADSRWQREVPAAHPHSQLPGVNKQPEHPVMARDVLPSRPPFESHTQPPYAAPANREMYNMAGAPSQVNNQTGFDRPYRNSDGPSRAFDGPAEREAFKDAYDEKELYKMSQPVRPPSFDRPAYEKNAFSEQQQQHPRPGQPPFVQGSLPRAPSSHDSHSSSLSENNKQYNNQQHFEKRPEKENINIGKGNLTNDKLRSGVSSHAGSSASSSFDSTSQKLVMSSDKRDDKTARDRDNNKDRDKEKSRDRDRSVKDPKDREGSDRDRDSNRRRRTSSRSRSRDRDRRRRHRSRSRSRDRNSRRRRSRSKERQERPRDRDKDKDKDKSRSASSALRDRGERRSNDGGPDKAAAFVEKPTSNSGATLPGLGEIPRELPKELSTTLVGKRNNQEMITSDMHVPSSQMGTNSLRAEAWPSAAVPSDKNTNKSNQIPYPGSTQSSFDRNMSVPAERDGLHASRWSAAHGKPSDPRAGSVENTVAEYDMRRPGLPGLANKRADDWDSSAGAPSKPWGHPEDPRRTIGQLSGNNMRTSEKDAHSMMGSPVPHFRDQKAMFENSRTSSERFQDDSWSASGKPIRRFPGPRENVRDGSWSPRDVPAPKGPVNGPHMNARLSDGGSEMRLRDPAYPHEVLPGGHQSHRNTPPRSSGPFHDPLPRGPLGPGDALARDPFKAPVENLPRVLLATPDIPPRNCMVEPPDHVKGNWRSPSDKPISGDPRSREHEPFVEGRSDRQHGPPHGPPHGPKHFSDDPLKDPSTNEKPEAERFVGNRHHREPGGVHPEERRDTEPFRGDRFADPRFRGDRISDDRFGEDFYEEGWEGGAGRGMPKRGGLDGRGAGRFLRRGFGRFDSDSYKEPYIGEGGRTVTPPSFDRPPRGTFRGASRFRSSRFPVDEPFEEGTIEPPPGGFRGRGGFGRGRGGRGGVIGGGVLPPSIGDRPPTCSIEMLNLPTTASYRSVREVFYGIFVPRDAIKLLGDENGHRIGVGLVRFQTERDAFEASQRDGSFIFENCIQIRLIDEEIYDKHEDVGLLNRFASKGPFDHSKEIMPTEWVHIKGIAAGKNEEDVAHIFSQYYINDILKEVNPQTKKITGGFFMRVSCPEEASTAVLECDGTETEEGIFRLRQALMEEVMEATLKFSERHNQDGDRGASDGEKEHGSRPSESREDADCRHDGPSNKSGAYINPNVAKHLDLVRGLDPKYPDRTSNDHSKDLNNKKPLLATPAASNSSEQQQERGKQDNTSSNGSSRDQGGSKRSIHEVTGGAEEGSPSAKKVTSTRDLLTDSVMITGVKMGTTRSNVVDFFSDAGLIPEHVHFEPYNPKQGGTVYVIFPQIANARQAVEKSGQYLGPASVGIELIAKPDVMTAMGLPFNPLELIKKGDGTTSKDVSNSNSTGKEHNEKTSNANNDNGNNNETSAKKESEERGAPVRLIRQPLLTTPQRSRSDAEARQPVVAPSPSSSSSSAMPSPQQQKTASPSLQEHAVGATDSAEVPKQGEVAPDKFGKPGCVVALGNIPFRAATEDIIAFLSRDFPRVVPENVIRRYNEHNLPTSDARVAFDSPQQAEEAINKLNRKMIFNRPIYLSLV